VGIPRKVGTGAWKFEVSEITSLKKVATGMLRSGGIYKKDSELNLILDYYADRATGKEVVEAFNAEVRNGIRTGRIRCFDVPFTYSEGLFEARHASRYHQTVLSPFERQSLIEEYVKGAVTGKMLAKKYGVPEATVSRLLKKRRINRNCTVPRSNGTGFD
jgi:hypothetical protein